MTSEKLFKPNFVLIDFENVQPDNISALAENHFHVYLFLGSKQKRLHVDLVAAMHDFGPVRSKYIQVTKIGPNALDFHITYYLGRLIAKHPEAYFHVISKDKGFDPLIEHLTTNGSHVARRDSVAAIPVLNIHKNSDRAEKLAAVVEHLKCRGSSKPRKEDTLKNTLRQAFKNDLSEAEILSVFNELKKLNYITLTNGKVTYSLPK